MKKIFLIVIFLSYLAIGCILFYLPKDESEISIRGIMYRYKMPYLTKFLALRERELYYKFWIDKVIASGVKDDKEKIIKIFDWIKKLPNIPAEINDKFRSIEQHDYDVLIKQYGTLDEKARVFCNFMAISGYPASKIYNGIGRVVVKYPKEFLYFNFETGEMGPTKMFRGRDDKKRCEEKLSSLDTICKRIKNKVYLWGDMNVSRYAMVFYLQKFLRQNPKNIKFLLDN